MIGCGLALNDTGFILVQATCPTSSLSRSVTLFLSPGARSLQWDYKREGERWGGGTRGPIGLWAEEPRVTGAPLCAKGVFGTLPSLPWLASASQVPFGLALCMQGVGVWLAGSLQPGHMQSVFDFLNLHLN